MRPRFPSFYRMLVGLRQIMKGWGASRLWPSMRVGEPSRLGLLVPRGAKNERAAAILALHGVAIRPRLSPAFVHLCDAVGRGGVRLLLFQPELVQGAQEQRKNHRAPAGGCLCYQLFGRPIAAW